MAERREGVEGAAVLPYAAAAPAPVRARDGGPMRVVQGYALAVGLVAAAAALTLLLLGPVFSRNPFPLFYAAVMVSAWFGGLGPGLLATTLAIWAVDYFFVPSLVSSTLGWDDVFQMFGFGGMAVLISSLNAMRRSAIAQRDALLAREHAARNAAEVEQRRSEFLSQASAVLASSLDYRTTLSSVAQLAVPFVADWCMVDVVEPGGELRRLAVAHASPLQPMAAVHLEERPRGEHADNTPLPDVIRTGQPEFIPDVSDHVLAAAARNERHLSVLRTMGIVSYMSVPLVARGRTLGAITFASAESARRYTRQDLRLADQLARRAAVAVDNARLYHDAQEANRMKDEFLATVSHELRTPLNAVLGWTQLLRAGDLDRETTDQAIETIERNAKAQARIVEDVLDVSRIIQGKLRLNVRKTELTSVIAAAVDAVRPAAEAKQIGLDLQLDVQAGPIMGDPDRLQQVVWNLISNAIKFTPAGGRVRVVLGRDAEDADAGRPAMTRVSVVDTGKGIAAEFLPHVFERFRQDDSSTTRSHSGLGLGLAIVRHLVELHGGAVRAESEGVGKGSTFTVLLPESTPAVPPATPVPAIEQRSVRLTDGASAALTGVRVLVVDDEPDARELIRTTLLRFGATVTTAASAREAIDAMKRLKLDVLISDIGMPEEDGYALIRKVRARERATGGVEELPAVALTAYARPDDRRLALAAGYQVHVAKPIEPAHLGAVIAGIVGRASDGPAADDDDGPGDADADDADDANADLLTGDTTPV